MQYAPLGNSGLIVSRLGLGTLTFGAGAGNLPSLYKVDQQGANRFVAQALAAGVNYFNTADCYAEGRSEEMLGAALGSRRREVVLGTKVGLRSGSALIDHGLSRRHLIAAVEASLRRLRTDWIDILILHCVDELTPLGETLETLQQLIARGKTRYVGVSNWPAWLTAKAIQMQRDNGWEQFRTAEMYYSLLTRDIEHEAIPMALDFGLGLQVWSPLAGGFLTGKYTREDPQGRGGRLSGHNFIPFDRQRGYAILDRLNAMARKRGTSPARLALAWLLSRQAVSSVIVGASSPDQLAENLSAVETGLDETDIAELDEWSAPAQMYPGWYAPMFSDQRIREALAKPTHAAIREARDS